LAKLEKFRNVIEGAFAKGADKQGNPEWRVSTSHLLEHILSMPKDRQNLNHTKRLAGIMRKLGWTSRTDAMWFGKKQKRGYSKPCE
jgi:hypothetical protein